MICPHCDHVNPALSRHCNACGALMVPLESATRRWTQGIKDDLWTFLGTAKLTLGLIILGVVGLIISLAWPEWLAPSVFFGGRWYTLYFWLFLALNVIVVAIKSVFIAIASIKNKGIVPSLWRWATSIHLAIALLMFLVVLGLVSTVLPQLSFNRSVDLISRYGPEEFDLLKRLGLTNLFSGWPFLIFVGLFTLNLSACTYKRLRASLSYFRIAMQPKRLKAFANMKHNAHLPLPSGQETDIRERVKGALRAKHYRIWEEGGQILAEKWRWERFAIDVFHVSLLVIIAALAVTNILGYDLVQANYEGDVFAVPQRSFQVRVDKFWSINYPGTERVMDWKTKLTVLENGQAVKTATIEVNHPLTYQGVSFYQAAMGEDWQGKARVTLQIVRNADDQDLGEYTTVIGESFSLPDEGITVKLGAFLPDFALTKNQVAYSKSQRLQNPAVYLQIFDRTGQQSFRTWSFSRMPELQALGNQAYRFYITGMTAPEFTGLELSWDPGMPVAYTGFFIAIVTLVGNFMFKHRQIWAYLDEQTGVLVLGAKVRKGEMIDEFETLVEKITLPTKETV